MTQRNSLQDLAQGILGKFLSRNNSIQGYWALGLLFSQALEQNTCELTLNLLQPERHSSSAQECAQMFHDYMIEQLYLRGFEPEPLKEAVVILTFKYSEPAPTMGRGDPFQAIVRLTHHSGNVFQVSGFGNCEPHDPQGELKRCD